MSSFIFLSLTDEQLVWKKDNMLIPASSRFTAQYDPVSGNIDVTFNYVKPCDTGVYVCTAENAFGVDETFSDLAIVPVPDVDERPQTHNPNAFNVLDMPQLYAGYRPKDDEQLQPPVVVVPLVDMKVLEEQPTLLSCKIVGRPQPKVFAARTPARVGSARLSSFLVVGSGYYMLCSFELFMWLVNSACLWLPHRAYLPGSHWTGRFYHGRISLIPIDII